jgi:hypothetical protein
MDKKLSRTPQGNLSEEGEEKPDLIEIYQRPYKAISLIFFGICVGLLGIAYVFVVVVTGNDLTPIGVSIFYTLMGAIFFLAVIEFLFRRELPLFLLKHPKIRIQLDPIRVGSTIDFIILFKPRIPIYLQSIAICLETKETITVGSGQHRRTSVAYTFVKGFKRDFKTKIAAGEVVKVKIPIHIHKYKQPTTQWGQNKIDWVVIAAAHIKGWPNWGRMETIEVRKA